MNKCQIYEYIHSDNRFQARRFTIKWCGNFLCNPSQSIAIISIITYCTTIFHMLCSKQCTVQQCVLQHDIRSTEKKNTHTHHHNCQWSVTYGPLFRHIVDTHNILCIGLQKIPLCISINNQLYLEAI